MSLPFKYETPIQGNVRSLGRKLFNLCTLVSFLSFGMVYFNYLGYVEDTHDDKDDLKEVLYQIGNRKELSYVLMSAFIDVVSKFADAAEIVAIVTVLGTIFTSSLPSHWDIPKTNEKWCLFSLMFFVIFNTANVLFYSFVY